jgi:TPR repeat protein
LDGDSVAIIRRFKQLGLVSLSLVPFLSFALAAAFAQSKPVDSALLSRANAGDPAAQVAVGDGYAKGEGVPQDYHLAADWYRKAAEKGNTDAQVRLAEFYRDGKGVTHDMTQAAAWYQKAADLGDPAAQGTLGTLYSVGQGVPQDYLQAYFWFDLAASVKGPNQERYTANRQNVGIHITADELALVQERIAKWKAEHPR